MLELYQGLDFAVFYPLYITVLLNVILSVFWMMNMDAPEMGSSFHSSVSQCPDLIAHMSKRDMRPGSHILILQKVRLKISPGEEQHHFS